MVAHCTITCACVCVKREEKWIYYEVWVMNIITWKLVDSATLRNISASRSKNNCTCCASYDAASDACGTRWRSKCYQVPKTGVTFDNSENCVTSPLLTATPPLDSMTVAVVTLSTAASVAL